MPRLFVPLSLAGLLAACATSSATNEGTPAVPISEQATLSELPPRTLKSGECGLFGWARESGRFIFFASADEAQFVSGQKLLRLVPSGDFPATQYSQDVTLKLGAPEFLGGGQRYPDARLVQTQADGFELIQPLVAVTSCVE